MRNHASRISGLFYYLSSIPTLLRGVRNWPQAVAIFLGLPVPKPLILRLRNGARFHVRTAMDVWVLKETCLDRQYQRASVELADNWVIIDIGAGIGDFAISAAVDYPHSTVYAYEPFPESFALLEENLRLNRAENVRAFPYALGGTAGTLSLRLSPEAVQHTTASEALSEGNIQVPGTTLAQVFAELNLPHCDYLKMDCEGAEYEILFNTGRADLCRIRRVCLEYHDGVTEFSHADLAAFFEKHGFRVRLTPNPVHSTLGYLYAANLRYDVMT